MPPQFSCASCQSTPGGAPFTPGQLAIDFNQQLRFAEIRQSLISSLPAQLVDAAQPLAGWRPGADLGTLLIDAWAYVGDVIGFYNNLAGAEAFIRTARQRRSLRHLGALLGYRPRPATAATAELAALVTPGRSVNLDGTAFRASPSTSSPAQAFEAAAGSRADARLNEFVLAPLRDPSAANSADGLFLEAATAGPVRGQPVVFTWFDAAAKRLFLHATEILGVNAVECLDKQTYIKIDLTKYPKFATTVASRDVSVQSTSLRAYARTAIFPGDKDTVKTQPALTEEQLGGLADVLGLTFGGYDGNNSHDLDIAAIPLFERTPSELYLDSVYRAISAGDIVILQAGNLLQAHRVTETVETLVQLGPGDPNADPPPSLVPLTRLTLLPKIDAKFYPNKITTRLIVHYNLHDIGRLTRPGYTELTADRVANVKLPLEGLHDNLPADQLPTKFVLEDANGRGVLVDATLDVEPTGAAHLTIPDPGFSGSLRVPVKAFGNIFRVTRGESVTDEILGNGDPTQPLQTFELKKSPLTYVPAQGAEQGVKTTLEVRVDGVRWHERPTFYGAGPQDQVYIVRHDENEKTFITFGDGVRGRRVPAGAGNVRASYRWGAGSVAPPPGAIDQVVSGISGLLRVSSPVGAYGGDDAEPAKQLRKYAPASALLLGRCVSLADFGARVAAYPGVRNSKVELAWDENMQAAVAKVWYLPKVVDADLGPGIVADLQAMSEPDTMIRAALASALKGAELWIGVAVDPNYVLVDVEAAVRQSLLDPETGMLAAENTPIGGVISRSELIAAIRAVPGVVDVTLLKYRGPGNVIGDNDFPFPSPGLAVEPGRFLDFTHTFKTKLHVHASYAEAIGCVDAGT